MNELRQTKEYKLSDQGGEYIIPYKGAEPQRQTDLNGDHGKQCPLDPVEEAKIEIVDKVTNHFQDMLFEMICEEMSNKYVFQSSNYLTEAGMEEFEEQFFEFYHEHHGDILAAIHNKLIY